MILHPGAAHEDGRVPRVALAEVCLNHVGREFLDLVKLADPALTQVLFLEYGDRIRDFVQ